MSTRTTIFILIFLSLALALAGAALRPLMGDALATHWNAQGQADGYGSPFVALYLLPLTILGVGILIVFLPQTDPLRANVEGFRATINLFALAFAAFMAYVHAITLLWNLDVRVNLNQVMAPAIAGLMYGIGVLMARAPRNFFIGIRTPWTLSNDLVWERTHRKGALAFKLVAGCALLGVFFPSAFVFLLLVPLLLTSLYLVLYSYLEYRKVANGNATR